RRRGRRRPRVRARGARADVPDRCLGRSWNSAYLYRENHVIDFCVRPLHARRAARLGVALSLVSSLWLVATAGTAMAAPQWLFRGLTLPRGDVALDLGLGLGHEPVDADSSVTGYGMNL